MKLIIVIMTTCLLQVSAAGFSQRITLSEQNTSLEQVLKKIKSQTGLDVLYASDLLGQANKVNLNLNNSTLVDALDKVFENQPLTYELKEKTIIITRKVPSFLDRVVGAFQTLDVSGRVFDDQGRPIPGVSIKIKDGKRMTTTDLNGRYSIVVPNESTILVFSYVGYQTKELSIKKSMLVTLETELNKLNEMVVVGYGSTRRKDLTGAVASVSLAEVRDVPFATIDQALTGKASGVQVVQADGSPGGVAKIRIRGGTSLMGGNDPLYIIDGVQLQVQNRYLTSAAEIKSPTESFGNDNADQTLSGSFARGLNSLGGLNMNDVESIDILKDASATAIYGSRAANGVVIITTKKGKYNQKPTLQANYYVGLNVPVKEKILNSDQYIMIMKEAALNLNKARAALVPAKAPTATANKILNDPNFLGTANTDWLDLVLRNGVTQNADISVAGGGSGSRYYTSLAYNKSNGSIIGTDYSRIAGKISLDNEITSKLKVNTNLDYGFTTNNLTNGIYTQALFAPPTIAPYNADGSVHIIDPAVTGAYGFEGFQNPLLLTKGINKANNVSLIGAITAEYAILKELKFKSSVAINYNNYHQTNYAPSTALIVVSGFMGSSNNGVATQAQSQSVDVFYENTITWDKKFNDDNRLNVLAGTSWQSAKTSSFSASGQGFPDDDYLNNLSSAALTLPATGISGQNSLLSFYMRANYSLFDKYLFTFTGRSDASSKFPSKNRVGYFPSGGVAWRLSQENFLKDVKWIEEIKLRASAGYTGTQNISDNLFYTLYSPVSYAGLNGLAPSQLGNDRIKWESTLQKDAGIDFQFFNSRLSGGIGYYEKSTSGVLFPTTVAGSSGFSGVTANIADIRNRGLELTIGGQFIKKKDFQWSGMFNISANHSKVLALSNDFADPSNPTVYKYGNTVLKVGEPLGLIYGTIYDGLLRTDEEVADYKKRNLFASFGQYPYLGIGDTKYVLDPATGFAKSDIIGRAEPKYYGGYTNSITYKNFSLTALATYSYGGSLLYLADIQNADASERTNKGIRILDRWTPESTNTDRPRLLLGQGLNFGNAASNNVYDASFIKLKSVTFSYQLPKLFLEKRGITSASVYVSAINLFTITNYPGADPEVTNDPYSIIGGYSDSGGYPTARQFSFGFRLGF